MGPLRVLAALFDIDTGKAKESLQSLDDGISSAKEMLTGLVEAGLAGLQFHAAKELVGEMIELGSVVNDTAERLGVGTDELQAFQFAAGLAGVGSQEAANALGFLNKAVGDALEGSKAQVAMFQGLDVALKDTNGDVRELGDVLPEVAEAFAGMSSDQERTTKAMQLFGRSGAALIPLLKGGAAGLEEMREEYERLGGGMDDEFIKAADETGDEIDKLRFAWKMWKTQITAEVLPVVKWVTQRFQSLTGGIRKVTRETNFAKYAWTAFGVSSALATGKAVGTWAKLMKIVPRDAGFWKTALGLGQWALVAGAAVLFGLVLEDIYTAIQGGDSLTKDWLTSFLGAKEASAILSDLKTSIEAIGAAFKEMGPVVGEFARGAMKMLASLVAELAADMASLVVGYRELTGTYTREQAAEHLGRINTSANALHDRIWSNPKPAGEEGVVPSVPSDPRQAGGVITLPEITIRAGEGGPPNVTQNIGDINVKVVGGPTNEGTGKAAAQGVQDGLAQQLQQAKATSET